MSQTAEAKYFVAQGQRRKRYIRT